MFFFFVVVVVVVCVCVNPQQWFCWCGSHRDLPVGTGARCAVMAKDAKGEAIGPGIAMTLTWKHHLLM